jgi:hypothetical protein
MQKNSHKDMLISDSGVTKTNKTLHISLFVFLCRALSVILAILGALALYKGNFG